MPNSDEDEDPLGLAAGAGVDAPEEGGEVAARAETDEPDEPDEPEEPEDSKGGEGAGSVSEPEPAVSTPNSATVCFAVARGADVAAACWPSLERARLEALASETVADPKPCAAALFGEASSSTGYVGAGLEIGPVGIGWLIAWVARGFSGRWTGAGPAPTPTATAPALPTTHTKAVAQ
jgi:hypothetical protein